MEIEPVYICGDFAVRHDGEISQGERGASFFEDNFTITRAEDEIGLNSIEKNGYPFFAGSMTFTRKVNLDDVNYKVSFSKKGINVIKLKVNGKDVSTTLWAPYEIDISEYLTVGENEIEITIRNNLRNLMGPHHLREGESYFVSPSSFYTRGCVWNSFHDQYFDKRYSLVEVSLI